MFDCKALSPQQHTRLFLQMLEREGTKNIRFDFRTFDDVKDRNRRDLLGNLTGTLAEREQLLSLRNSEGGGVFAVVNKGGHSDKEIARIRAVFADTDGAPLQPLVDALPPHFVVRSSPGKYHVYWLVDEAFPLERFKPIQTAIAKKFGTDGAVTNLSRVMRVPGFKHNKGEPVGVVLQSFDPDLLPYSIEQIVEGLGLSLGESSEKRGNAGAGQGSCEFSEVESMLRFINPWSDRLIWLRVLFGIADEFGEAGRDLAVRWSRGDLLSEPKS